MSYLRTPSFRPSEIQVKHPIYKNGRQAMQMWIQEKAEMQKKLIKIQNQIGLRKQPK